ncbi:MAG: tetratricopeptide repeat protein [Bacteroidota bacterium]
MELDIEIINLLKTGNLDAVGKCHLRKANEHILQGEFNSAYENIIKGYEFITCDCFLGNWLKKGLNKMVGEPLRLDCETYQFHLVQAFAYWLSKEFEAALISINKYIEVKSDEEIGYYLKGRIYSGMENFLEAIECYSKGLLIKRTNKALYRIGRTKEECLNENGLPELYEASLDNVISHCSGRLAENSVKRGIFLPNDDAFFSKSFNDSGSLFFVYCERTEENIKLKDGSELNFLQEKARLLYSLIENRDLFLID